VLNIYVNNQPHCIDEDFSLVQLIALTGHGDQMIAIAINGEFVSKALYSSTKITDSDKIDIVKPIGGG
jgi:sulfur carrier protein